MMENNEYTEEDMCCPWDYGDQSPSSEDSSDSEWSDEKKNIIEIPENLKRPGTTMLRSLTPTNDNHHLNFDQYCQRMKETFTVERLEDSTIKFIVSTVKKFLEFTSRNISEFPENDGINHQVNFDYEILKDLICYVCRC
jgi:hypothetical protein